jgi:glyceraldehyde 3-phosphate dehydrogenase
MVICAVNGFGRIGRLVFRLAWEDPLLDIVHVNDVCSCESAAYLIKYDSVHGTWNKNVVVNDDGSGFTVDGKLVTFSREKDYTAVPWKDAYNVDLVMECTGQFIKVKHLEDYFTKCNISRVVVSAPVKEEGALNVVLGCNHHLLTEDTRLVTNASCTTNW